MEPDVLALVIEGLAERLDCWVADTLPPADDLSSNLPCVVVDELPGEARTPWGGGPAGLIVQAIDIDVFDESRYKTRKIRELITPALREIGLDSSNSITDIRYTSTFHTRPDFNRTIRRVGAELEITARIE